MKKISIIIPVYNVEKYINQCLESVINQTYGNLQIVIVDDGSTDNSGYICDKWAEIDNRILVIHKENGGLSSARNSGLDRSDGNYIAFVDSDDVLHKDFCLKMISAMNETPSIDIVACGVAKFNDGDINQYKAFFPYISTVCDDKGFWRLILTHKCDNAAWGKLFKRDVIINNRFRKGIINEDLAFYLDITQNIKKVKYIDVPLYFYRVRPGSITTKINPRISDFFNNALEAKSKIAMNKDWDLQNEADGFLFTEITNILSTIEKFNSRKAYNQLYDEMLSIIRKNPIYALRNKYWSFSKKIKFFLVVFTPSIYRSLLKRK